MSEELWINTQEDWSDFASFMQESDSKLISTYSDRDGQVVYEFQDMKVHVPDRFHNTNDFKKSPTNPISEVPNYDSLIFGRDSTEKIVNITVDNEIVYIYKSDGSCEQKEYYNWALGANWAEGAIRLKGNQFYKFLKEMPEDQFYQLKNNWNPRIWTPRSAPEGYMLRSGSTYYKGLKVSDVSLLSFDIEATSLDPNDPEAFVPLLSVTYRNRAGQIDKRMFDIFEYTDKLAMWTAINTHVQEKDPDIILGHNILSYDLPYANKNSPGLDWGRDTSKIIFDEKVSKKRKDASQQYEYFNATIHGREIVDTFFLALTYDIAREFPSYGLKAIEKHLGLVKEDRSWDFQKWPVKKLIEAKKSGNHEIWQKFREYCQDDSDSPIKMFDIMIPSFFYLAQSVPKTLQQMVCEASGSQLDGLMVRSYLQDGYSLPRSSKKEEFEGAISMGIPGAYKNVRKVDVASLYPSIMLAYDIYDKVKDPHRNMLKILEYFRNERLKNKKLAKETSNKYYDDLQNAQKVAINSMYGFLGANYLLFNYPEGAAKVTKYGREILLKGVEWATGHTLEKVVKKVIKAGKEDEVTKYHWILGAKVQEGLSYQLVNVDTDSFSYTNNLLPTKQEFDQELANLNKLYPELIKWEKDGEDGIFDKIIVVGAKNYVLVRKGKIKLKGSSLTDQKKEPRLLQLLESFIDTLLKDILQEEKDALILQDYNKCCLEVVRDFKVKEWLKKVTVTKAVLNPERSNEQGPKDAIDEAIQKGVISGTQEGDKVWLYTALDGERQKTVKSEPQFSKKGEPSMEANDVYRFPELYKNDQYTKYYLNRVYDTLCILENIVEINVQDGFKMVKGEQVPKMKQKIPGYHLKSNQKLLEDLK